MTAAVSFALFVLVLWIGVECSVSKTLRDIDEAAKEYRRTLEADPRHRWERRYGAQTMYKAPTPKRTLG